MIEKVIKSVEAERKRREIKEGFCAYRKKHLRGVLCMHPYALPGVECSKAMCPIFNDVYATIRYDSDGELHLRVKTTRDDGKPIREERAKGSDITRELIDRAAEMLPEKLREEFLKKAKTLLPELF